MSYPDDCAICMESLPGNDCLNLQLPCHPGHIFHKNCIDDWAEKNASCPLCRAALRKSPRSNHIWWWFSSCCFLYMITLYLVAVIYVVLIVSCIVSAILGRK